MLSVGTSDVILVTAVCKFASLNDVEEMTATFEGCKEFLLTDWIFQPSFCDCFSNNLWRLLPCCVLTSESTQLPVHTTARHQDIE